MTADQREQALAAFERIHARVPQNMSTEAPDEYAMQDVVLVRAALTPLPDSVDEVAALIAAERARQVAKGYDDEHDDEHGIPHLVKWAQAYIHRGEPVKAMAILASVLDVHERAQAVPLPADLAEIQALIDALPERPWEHQPYGGENENGDLMGGHVFAGGDYLIPEVGDAEGAFIARAPEIIDRLVAELAELRARPTLTAEQAADILQGRGTRTAWHALRAIAEGAGS